MLFLWASGLTRISLSLGPAWDTWGLSLWATVAQHGLASLTMIVVRRVSLLVNVKSETVAHGEQHFMERSHLETMLEKVACESNVESWFCDFMQVT